MYVEHFLQQSSMYDHSYDQSHGMDIIFHCNQAFSVYVSKSTDYSYIINLAYKLNTFYMFNEVAILLGTQCKP